MSFVNATLVLSIGETVEEVTDSGFLGTTPTLSCSLLGEDALVQVGEMFRFINSIPRNILLKIVSSFTTDCVICSRYYITTV